MISIDPQTNKLEGKGDMESGFVLFPKRPWLVTANPGPTPAFEGPSGSTQAHVLSPSSIQHNDL